MNKNSFKNIQKGLNNLSNKFSETDIVSLLDFSASKENIDELVDGISKQSAIIAYIGNLKNEADEKYKEYVDKLENFESKKNKIVIEHIKSDGIKIPTAKLIKQKFLELYDNNEFYIKCNDLIKLWRKRREATAIVLKALDSREQSFKSLSYMMDTMIKAGLFYPKSKKDRSIE